MVKHKDTVKHEHVWWPYLPLWMSKTHSELETDSYVFMLPISHKTKINFIKDIGYIFLNVHAETVSLSILLVSK